ncbi:hypothetical protein HOF65_01070 [bacterium]|nr:hypothetical protein [bacterium]MBT3852631.1 hypothetical protein [bacterium]MBT4633580.1 hypothetical protein [bacterium]
MANHTLSFIKLHAKYNSKGIIEFQASLDFQLKKVIVFLCKNIFLSLSVSKLPLFDNDFHAVTCIHLTYNSLLTTTIKAHFKLT